MKVATAEDIFISKEKNKHFVKITIIPPNESGLPGLNRVSHDIACVLDISGSMASYAKVRYFYIIFYANILINFR